MEYLLTAEMFEKNRALLKGRIFTELQLDIIRKRLSRQSLTGNEKTYYYKFIKPKMNAMLSLFNISGINVCGQEHILEGRLEKAEQLLKKMEANHKKKKIMISGSFLFSRKYNDIDVFVFAKYKKDDYRKAKIHVNFLDEKALDSMFFASLSQISVSNFKFAAKNHFDVDIADLMLDYETLLAFLMDKCECQKELRDFLLKANYAAGGAVLSPMQLFNLKERLAVRNASGIISNIFINTLALGYSMAFLKRKLAERIAGYRSLAKTYKKQKSLDMYMSTYKRAMELEA
ncbi:MAG: hypothetical protein V1659_04750 [Candidatus Woesearchaeota archaeon]